MNDLIYFITGGAETFTPSVMVGLIVFCLILDSLSLLVSTILGVTRK